MNLQKREDDLDFRLLILEVKGNLVKTREVVKDNESQVPVLLDSESFSREVLHVTSTPTMIIIDRRGRIRCRLIGTMEDMEGIVEEILSRI